jgi:hypothetical protein
VIFIAYRYDGAAPGPRDLSEMFLAALHLAMLACGVDGAHVFRR